MDEYIFLCRFLWLASVRYCWNVRLLIHDNTILAGSSQLPNRRLWQKYSSNVHHCNLQMRRNAVLGWHIPSILRLLDCHKDGLFYFPVLQILSDIFCGRMPYRQPYHMHHIVSLSYYGYSILLKRQASGVSPCPAPH